MSPRPLGICLPLILIWLMGWAPFSWAGGEAAPESKTPSLRCHTCGQPILGAYYKIPGLPELYCEKCYKTLPHCFYCGRPFRFAVKGSKPVCESCRAEAVNNTEEALRIVQRVRTWIESNLALQLPRRIEFRFVEDLAPYVGVQLSGRTRELGAYIREGNQVRILLLSGMPRPTLIEAAAHELAHVWQAGRIPRNQRLLLKEGFAQWVAAKALVGFDCQSAMRVLAQREDLYGEGYRHIKDIEDRGGVEGTLTYVKQTE